MRFHSTWVCENCVSSEERTKFYFGTVNLSKLNEAVQQPEILSCSRCARVRRADFTPFSRVKATSWNKTTSSSSSPLLCCKFPVLANISEVACCAVVQCILASSSTPDEHFGLTRASVTKGDFRWCLLKKHDLYMFDILETVLGFTSPMEVMMRGRTRFSIFNTPPTCEAVKLDLESVNSLLAIIYLL